MVPSIQDVHDISDYFRNSPPHPDPMLVESILWSPESEYKSAIETCKTLHGDANHERALSTADRAIYVVLDAFPSETRGARPPISSEALKAGPRYTHVSSAKTNPKLDDNKEK